MNQIFLELRLSCQLLVTKLVNAEKLRTKKNVTFSGPYPIFRIYNPFRQRLQRNYAKSRCWIPTTLTFKQKE